MQKILFVFIWTVSFVILSGLAKSIAVSLNFDEGIRIWLFKNILGDCKLYIMVLLYFVCALMFFLLLRVMPLSVAGPLVSILGIVFTAGLGIAVFHEQITAVKICGFILCGLGIICILWSERT